MHIYLVEYRYIQKGRETTVGIPTIDRPVNDTVNVVAPSAKEAITIVENWKDDRGPVIIVSVLAAPKRLLNATCDGRVITYDGVSIPAGGLHKLMKWGDDEKPVSEMTEAEFYGLPSGEAK